MRRRWDARHNHRDYGIARNFGSGLGYWKPFWGSSYLRHFKRHVHYEKGKELTLFSCLVLNKLDYVTVYSFFKSDIISFYDPQYDMHLIRKRRFFKLVSTDPASCCFFGTLVASHQFLSSSLNSKKNTKQLPYLNKKELHCDLPTKMKPVHLRQENWLVPIGRVQDQRAVDPVQFLCLPTLRVLQHWEKGTTFVSNMVHLPSFSGKVGKPTDPTLKGKKSYWGEGVQGQGFWQWPPIVCCPWPWVGYIL